MRELLWTPSEEVQKASNMYAFMELVNREKGRNYRNYRELYRFSVDEPEAFWDILFRYLDIVHSVGYERTVDDIHRFPGAKWFPGCRLNYAENLLRHEANDEACLIFRGEDKVRRVLTWKDVKEQTFRLATALRELGVGAGDAVSAYLPNLPETIIAMLATAAVGGVWCSCATDIGPGAAFDRLGQVSPKVLFTTDGYYYKGKEFDTLPNAAQVAARMEGLKKVVVVHYAGKPEDIATVPNAVLYEDFLAKAVPEPFVYEQREFNDPTVVMFSSGTTGKPKCMVQSVGGLLINQLKELVLHHDMKPSDRMLYITTCSWMMWNWQAATLGAGSSIVLYDGNPSYPDLDAIWKVLEEEGGHRLRPLCQLYPRPDGCGLQPQGACGPTEASHDFPDRLRPQRGGVPVRVSGDQAGPAFQLHRRRHGHQRLLLHREPAEPRVRGRAAGPGPGHEDRMLRRERQACPGHAGRAGLRDPGAQHAHMVRQ